jgi:hypothetical protein
VSVTCLVPGATFTEFSRASSAHRAMAFNVPGLAMPADRVARAGVAGMLRGDVLVVPVRMGGFGLGSLRVRVRVRVWGCASGYVDVCVAGAGGPFSHRGASIATPSFHTGPRQQAVSPGDPYLAPQTAEKSDGACVERPLRAAACFEGGVGGKTANVKTNCA